jgi:DNA repair protein RecN (Recombination protein N)
MLLRLSVKNLGIIEDIDWRLETGLNVITGETGAGKSLVIDAVEALLAGKADEEVIRHGAEEARIEGIFELPGTESTSRLRAFLEDNGISVEEEILVIDCEFRKRGRSISRINGRAIPRGLLRQIGNHLVDIHGQSEHLSLLDRNYHLNFLDSYAHTTELRNIFSSKAAELHKAGQELKALADEAKDLARREEFLCFQIDEITQAGLREGEIEELEKERNILSSSEKLKTLSYEAYQALHGGDTPSVSAIDKLNEAVQLIKRVADLDPSRKQQLDSIEGSTYAAEEAARGIRAYSDGM